jgi:hypothetical protein
MTTSFASGSSAFGNDNNDVHQFTGSVQITGSISLNGQAIGTGKLDETTFQSYTSSNNSRVSSLETSSGSLNSFTSSINTTIKSKLDSDNVISGSIQVILTGTTVIQLLALRYQHQLRIFHHLILSQVLEVYHHHFRNNK